MLLGILSFLLNILILVFILGVVIFLHELGHFVAAKLMKIRIDEFAFGMGPKLIGKKIGETEYKINAFPIGGYVAMHGDEDNPSGKLPDSSKDPRSFQSKNVWQKTFVLLAGVFMNLMTAVVIYYAFMAFVGFKFPVTYDVANRFEPVAGEITTEIEGPVEYIELSEDGGAQEAGWPDNGIVESYGVSESNMKDAVISYEFTDFIVDNAGKVVAVTICEDVDTSCETYPTEISDEGIIGIVIPANTFYHIEYNGMSKLFVGFGHAFNTVKLGGMYIGDIFSEASATGDYSTAANTVSGPIGLYLIIDFFKQYGVWGILELLANISLTLFVMNLLPIPVLDGGRVVLIFAEKIMGDRYNKDIEAWLIKISYILLMVFMLLIAIKDVFFISEFKELIGG